MPVYEEPPAMPAGYFFLAGPFVLDSSLRIFDASFRMTKGCVALVRCFYSGSSICSEALRLGMLLWSSL